MHYLIRAGTSPDQLLADARALLAPTGIVYTVAHVAALPARAHPLCPLEDAWRAADEVMGGVWEGRRKYRFPVHCDE